MVLAFPRDVRTRMFLNGQWRDVSSHTRQETISITHARKDEAPKPSPSRATLMLDDGPGKGNGDYDPTNPLGQWFGSFGENTPIEMAVRCCTDTFSRTVVDGWGTSDTGDVWTSAGGTGGAVLASDWQVAAGVATQSVPAAPGFRYSVMAGLYRNVTATGTVTVAISNISGAALEPANVILRRTAGVYYMARVVVDAAEVLTISIHHSLDGQLVAPVTVPGLVDAVSSKVLTVRFQAEDNTLRAKVYAPGAEPLGWHVEVDDTRITTAGQVGIRNGVASGNTNTKPIVFSVDNFTVDSPRFVGGLSKVEPLAELDHSNRRTKLEALGLLNLLGRRKQVLETALYRYITRGDAPFGVADFWPLDREQDANDRGANTSVGGSTMDFFRATGGAIKWGTDTGLLPVKRAVTLVPPVSGSGQMLTYFRTGMFNAANGWGLMWYQRVSSEGQASLVVDLDNSTQLFLKFEPGIARLQLLPAATTLMTVGVPQVGDDAVWHTIALGCRQSGGNILYHLTVDDDSYEVSAAGTTGLPRWAVFSAFPGQNFTYEVTQVLAMTNDPLTGSPWHVVTARAIYLGRLGETAGARIDRLCREEGVAHGIVGTLADSPAMGPQQPLPFMDLIGQCMDVDQGIIHDGYGAASLSVRLNSALLVDSIFTPDPVLSLDYSNEEIGPTFSKVIDSTGTLNDVTAQRPNGGKYRIEQITGPRNTADPGTIPGAVGTVDATPIVNVQTDAQLPDQAGWRVHLGTNDEPRYPTITVDLAATALVAQPDLAMAVLDTSVGDYVEVINAQNQRVYQSIRQIVRGYTETFRDTYGHKIVFNTTPASSYDVLVFDGPTDRWDANASTLNEVLDIGETGMDVASSDLGETWVTTASNPGAFPFDITVGGEPMTVSAITGTGPWTFTVTRTLAKQHQPGASVRIARRKYFVP